MTPQTLRLVLPPPQPMTTETTAIEVVQNDQLKGYAIFFSGYWDAYVKDGSHSLICLGNFLHREGAVQAIKEGEDWRMRKD